MTEEICIQDGRCYHFRYQDCSDEWQDQYKKKILRKAKKPLSQENKLYICCFSNSITVLNKNYCLMVIHYTHIAQYGSLKHSLP